MITSRQHFEIEVCDSFDQVFKNWEFFLEGLEELNNISKIGRRVGPDEFLKVLLSAGPGGAGVLWIIRSINNKPLMFGVALDDTAPFKPKSVLVYAAWSNKKNNEVMNFARERFEIWATEQGYKEIHAFSYRFTKSGFNLFQRLWGFKKKAVLFTKDL